jgi:hypothetical protein
MKLLSMNALTKAIVVALIQVLIVCSLGAKLLYDRSTRPQVWFKTARYDPNLPIRGRYLGLQVELNDPRPAEQVAKKFGVTDRYAWMGFGQECGSIVARDGKPVVVFDNSPAWDCDNLQLSRWRTTDGVMHLRLEEPLLFFIPDTAKDPRGPAKKFGCWLRFRARGRRGRLRWGLRRRGRRRFSGSMWSRFFLFAFIHPYFVVILSRSSWWRRTCATSLTTPALPAVA